MRRKHRAIWWSGIGVFLLILLSSIVIYYHYFINELLHVKHYVLNAKMWLNNNKQHLNERLVKAKSFISEKHIEEEPVHFEFYTALPNMQMSQSVVKEQRDKPMASVSAQDLEKELAQHVEKAKKRKDNDI